MYKGKSFLAIVPARGGSKRLANKNCLLLDEKPLISYSIDAAKQSKYIDEIIVSTDSEIIAGIAKEMDISVPFLRPDEISQDTSSQIDVVMHTINFLSDVKKEYDYIILLQPTSPFRSGKHIDESIHLLAEEKAQAIVSVCKMEHSPLWCNTLGENNSMDDFLQDNIINKQSQELDSYYNLNGAIYIIETKTFIKEKKFFLKKNIYAYIMNKISSIDIDDEYDLLYAASTINFRQT